MKAICSGNDAVIVVSASGLPWWSYSATFMCMNIHACTIHLVFAFLCQGKGGALAIIIALVGVPDRVWKSDYIHVSLSRLGYNICGCTIGWAVFMYCYISLKTSADNPKSWEMMGQGVGWVRSNCN